MLNMGGPSSLHDPHTGVEPFLRRLFTDGDIIKLGPLQPYLGPYIAKRRAPRIANQYAQIGGGSPIGRWTQLQGEAMVAALNARPDLVARHGPFKFYVAFRYAPPLTAEALSAMKVDGVERAVAFSQYPQFSCTTTGSSLNHLWREASRLHLHDAFRWSVIDRWYNHPTFIAAVARRVAVGLARFPAPVRDQVVIVFSAHSIPMMIVNRGDPYTGEVAATVSLVMDRLRAGVRVAPSAAEGSGSSTSAIQASGQVAEAVTVAAPSNPHILSWQSKVGFLPWMGPSTADVLTGLGRQGHAHVLVVPIAFTSDHIETLFEIDIEYAHLAKQAGITNFQRAPSLNDEPLLHQAQAELVADHLTAGEAHATSDGAAGGATVAPLNSSAVCSRQYPLNCAGCINPECRHILNPAFPYVRWRDHEHRRGHHHAHHGKHTAQ